jgi:hypothetical protein
MAGSVPDSCVDTNACNPPIRMQDRMRACGGPRTPHGGLIGQSGPLCVRGKLRTGVSATARRVALWCERRRSLSLPGLRHEGLPVFVGTVGDVRRRRRRCTTGRDPAERSQALSTVRDMPRKRAERALEGSLLAVLSSQARCRAKGRRIWSVRPTLQPRADWLGAAIQLRQSSLPGTGASSSTRWAADIRW